LASARLIFVESVTTDLPIIANRFEILSGLFSVRRRSIPVSNVRQFLKRRELRHMRRHLVRLQRVRRILALHLREKKIHKGVFAQLRIPNRSRFFDGSI